MWLVKIHTLVQYKNRLQTRLLIAWWPWTLVKVTEILSLLRPIPIMYLWQICQNPCIGSLDILQIRLNFTVLIMWWPWNLGQGHQILIKLFIYLSQWYNTWCLVWIHHLVQEFGCRQAFVEPNLPFKVPMWPWKRGQDHQNLTTSFSCTKGISMQVWSKSIYCRKSVLFKIRHSGSWCDI